MSDRYVSGKQWVRLLLCAALIVLLTACEGEDKKGQEADATVSGTVTLGGNASDITGEPALSETAAKEYQFAKPVQGAVCAEIVIRNYGSLYVKLFESDAPLAVENFTKLAEQGDYDNIKIGKIIDGYMFQAGDKEGTGASGESAFGKGFVNEISDKLLPVRGALCMANEGKNGTNTIQFFVVQTPAEVVRGLAQPLDSRYHMTLREYFEEAYNTKVTTEQLHFFETYGGAPWLTGQQTIFGQIYDGYEVLDALMEAKVTSKLKPNPSVYIDAVRIFRYEG